MGKLMVKVVRDRVAEFLGVESRVGDFVEVIKKIPAYHHISVHRAEGEKPSSFPTRYPVYLVKSQETRWYDNGKRCDKSLLVKYQGYAGNDIYTAEELGVEL